MKNILFIALLSLLSISAFSQQTNKKDPIILRGVIIVLLMRIRIFVLLGRVMILPY